MMRPHFVRKCVCVCAVGVERAVWKCPYNKGGWAHAWGSVRRRPTIIMGHLGSASELAATCKQIKLLLLIASAAFAAATGAGLRMEENLQRR